MMAEPEFDKLLETTRVVEQFVVDNLPTLCQELIDMDGYITIKGGKLLELAELMYYTNKPLEIARNLVYRAALKKLVKDSTLYNS